MPPKPRANTKTPGNRRMLLIALGVAAAIAVALIAASLAFRGGDDTPEVLPTDTELVDGIEQNGTVLGNPDAKVTLFQYEDIQCPVCRQYTAVLFPIVVDEYVRDGRVNVDFRGLDSLGEDSNQALRWVLAAARQDKAWQMIELLYANQGEENSGWVTDVLLEELAASIPGLDVEQVKRDAEDPAIREEIGAVAAEAQERGVEGTPWFFVKTAGGELVELRPEGLDAAAMRTALDQALAA